MIPFASLADPEEVRRALLSSLALIRCKCLHTVQFVERGVCSDCEAWAHGGAARTFARVLCRASGAHSQVDAAGRWTLRASLAEYEQIGRWLAQLARLAQGEDPDAPERAA